MISAANSWVLVFENISAIPQWLSDALCSLATGGGYATRTLYTNEDETFLDARRPIVLNGIVDYATRGDLVDRCLFLHLATIDEKNRLPEAVFWRRWETDYPLILGALLDAIASALRVLPSIKPEKFARMADFDVWAQAVYVALGWDPAEFSRSYLANREHAHETILEDSPLTGPLRSLVGHSRVWEGTATELLAALDGIAGEKVIKSKLWPKSPGRLSGNLRRLAPTLRHAGIDITHDRDGKGGRKKTIAINKCDPGSDARTDTDRSGPICAREDRSRATPVSDASCNKIRTDGPIRTDVFPPVSGDPPF
jgi:hypothetical protein